MQTPKERSATQPEAAFPDVLNHEGYRKFRGHVFPSDEALKYFIRKHRIRLFECGALLEVGGRHLIVGSKFDAAVIELGNAPRATTGKST